MFSMMMVLTQPPLPPLEKSRFLPSRPEPAPHAVKSSVAPPVPQLSKRLTDFVACPEPVPLVSGLLADWVWWVKFSLGTLTLPKVLDSPVVREICSVVVLRDTNRSSRLKLYGYGVTKPEPTRVRRH